MWRRGYRCDGSQCEQHRVPDVGSDVACVLVCACVLSAQRLIADDKASAAARNPFAMPLRLIPDVNMSAIKVGTGVDSCTAGALVLAEFPTLLCTLRRLLTRLHLAPAPAWRVEGRSGWKQALR